MYYLDKFDYSDVEFLKREFLTYIVEGEEYKFSNHVDELNSFLKVEAIQDFFKDEVYNDCNITDITEIWEYTYNWELFAYKHFDLDGCFKDFFKKGYFDICMDSHFGLYLKFEENF